MNDALKSGFEWQKGIWDDISEYYVDEIARRFRPVCKNLLDRAELSPRETVLDLGAGTGLISFAASTIVGNSGKVTAVDISSEMLVKAKGEAEKLSLSNIEFLEGRAEEIPVPDQSQDAVLSSLCIMYVIERDKAAKEISRILRPSGRFVACVWAGPDRSDIVKFQEAAGSFAPEPPVKGVGPGALADPESFLLQLKEAGFNPKVELIYNEFEFPNFQEAWDVLTGPTAANLDPASLHEAMSSVQKLMWENPTEPRKFRNGTHYISAIKTE